jgi:hypothetical protein
VLFPDIERLWRSWWSVEAKGRAVSALQYISCLMYPANENPVFALWTPDAGGGPPYLWEFEGHLYNHRWLEPNVSFLREILAPQRVAGTIHQAVGKLKNEPENDIAVHIQEDVPLCIETLEARCAELPQILEKTNNSGLLEWTS